MSRPNIILFCTDQQRSDSLGCTGNPIARTPHIDSIAKRGACLTRHIVTCQICGPSRASMFSGLYPRHHGKVTNGCLFDASILTLPAALTDHGYRTHGIGKFHFQPSLAPAEAELPESYAYWQDREADAWNGPYCGFQTVEMVIGDSHRTVEAGHYGKWLQREHPDAVPLMLQEHAATPAPPDLLECWQPAIDPALHYNAWIADRAVAFLDHVDEPFFLFVSFPDPHHPFAPPGRYAHMYDPASLPDPRVVEGELDQMPEYYRHLETMDIAGGTLLTEAISEPSLRRAMAYTYGMVSMIDDCVGRVLAAIEDIDNSYVLFTSDHGELLGDHGLLKKGPMPYRQLCEVPMLAAGPGIASGQTCDALTSHIDLMPTILDLAGCEHARGDGLSLASTMMGEEPPSRPHVFSELHPRVEDDVYSHTIHTQQQRLTLYPNRPDWGEMFDHRSDPYEHYNLFNEPEHAALRDELTTTLQSEFPPMQLHPESIAAW